MTVKMGASSPNRDENKKYLKPPPKNRNNIDWDLQIWYLSMLKFGCVFGLSMLVQDLMDI